MIASAIAVFLASAQPMLAILEMTPGDQKSAADEKKALALYADGEAAYKVGRFEDALVAFQSAYAAEPVAGLLFNIGQCHRQLKHHAEAASFFERYLDEDKDAPNRADVSEMLAEERAQAAPSATHSTEAADAHAANATGATATTVASTTGDDVDPPIWQTPVFWGVAGGAAVAVLVGTTVAIVVATQPPAPSPTGSLGTFDLRAP